MTDSMPLHRLCPPVLLIVFNRPETTRHVFQEIRRAKPARFYIGADGPRSDRAHEAERSAEVRRIVTEVDWPCEVKTLFRAKNLGCRAAVSEAITWFFEHEEGGIILEDDCLPNTSFFAYCGQLLERYRTDDRVMHISGWSPRPVDDSVPFSYTFSRYPRAWGWATWRRAWAKYRPEPTAWSEAAEQQFLIRMFEGQKRLARLWARTFNSVYAGRIDTWDYQWVLSCWLNDGLSIAPKFNMVRNIGFGADATHTTDEKDDRRNLKVMETPFPLVHPPRICRNPERDRTTVERDFLKAERFWLLRQFKSLVCAVFRTPPNLWLSKLRSNAMRRAG